MTFVEQIHYELSSQRKILSGVHSIATWAMTPFCRNAEYYFYLSLLKRSPHLVFEVIDPDQQYVHCFQKSDRNSETFGIPTHMILEGRYAGLLFEHTNGYTTYGRYLFDTCSKVPGPYAPEQWLTQLTPHTYIDCFLKLLGEMQLPYTADTLKNNSLRYSAWIRRRQHKELLGDR